MEKFSKNLNLNTAQRKTPVKMRSQLTSDINIIHNSCTKSLEHLHWIVMELFLISVK